MDTKHTKEWAYKITSPTSINFYHILFPQLGFEFINPFLGPHKNIVIKNYHYLTITTETPIDLQILIKNLEEKLESEQTKYAQIRNYTYALSPKNKAFIKEWFLSIEGALALTTIFGCQGLNLNPYNFEFLSSPVGGIYIKPLTILFYENFAKVIHPIRVDNYFLREEIERTLAISMRGILKRGENASPGQGGLAIASYVEYKTGLPQNLIADIISRKANNVEPPRYSPILTSYSH